MRRTLPHCINIDHGRIANHLANGLARRSLAGSRILVTSIARHAVAAHAVKGQPSSLVSRGNNHSITAATKQPNAI